MGAYSGGVPDTSRASKVSSTATRKGHHGGRRPVIFAALILAATMTAVAGLLLTGGAGASVIADPGFLVRWGLPVMTVVVDLAASLTIGLLVVAAALVPNSAVHLPGRTDGRSQGILRPVALRLTRVAALSASVWASAAAMTAVLTYARISGQEPTSSGFATQLGQYLFVLEPLRAWVISAVVVTVVAGGAMLALRLFTVGWLMVLSLAALIPLAYVGHSANQTDHELGVTSLAAHVIGAAVWVGGALAITWARTNLADAVPVVIRRYSVLAGWAFAAVAVSGLINAWAQLGGWADLGSQYGVLMVMKGMALIALGALGVRHRRRTIPALVSSGVSQAAAFWRWFAGELVLMVVTIGVAVALANSAPPTGNAQSDPDAATILTGYPMPEPLTASAWFTAWRVDLLWLAVAVGALGLYVGGARRLRRRGDSWPVLRVLSFVAGCLILIWATSGSPGVYGRVLFSSHMLGHLVVSMVVPPLLVLGAPMTLAMRGLTARRDGSHGPREWLLAVLHSRFLALLSRAPVAAVIFAGSLVVFYYSPLFEWSIQTHTGHVLMHAHFLASGYLFASVLVGVDPGPARPAYPMRLVVLFATMAFHAFFGVSLASGTQVLAGAVLHELDRPWGVAPLLDQQQGGAIAWGLGEIPAVALALGIAVAWARSDSLEARRRDRQADRDGEAELRAYNDRLAALAGLDRRQSHGGGLGGQLPNGQKQDGA
ncbi:MAG: cytochrome c oxidase assembly protein [Actinomycetota bacterium]